MTVRMSEVVGPDQMLVDITGWRCVSCGAYWEAHQKPSEGPRCCDRSLPAKVSIVSKRPSWMRKDTEA